MSQASYLRDLASGDVPVDAARLNRSADTLEGAQTALSDTRRVMALLLDAAACRGLKDTDPIAQRALRTIAAIDQAVPHTHDMGTGLPLRAIEATRPPIGTDEVVGPSLGVPASPSGHSRANKPQRHGNADGIGRLIARELRSGNNRKCLAPDCHSPAKKGEEYCSVHAAMKDAASD